MPHACVIRSMARCIFVLKNHPIKTAIKAKKRKETKLHFIEIAVCFIGVYRNDNAKRKYRRGCHALSSLRFCLPLRLRMRIGVEKAVFADDAMLRDYLAILFWVALD